MCHDELDAPPLQFRDKRRNAFERIIGVKAFESQRVQLVITIGGEPIAESSDKTSRAFLVTAAEESYARRCRAFRRQGRSGTTPPQSAASSFRRFMPMIPALQEVILRTV